RCVPRDMATAPGLVPCAAVCTEDGVWDCERAARFAASPLPVVAFWDSRTVASFVVSLPPVGIMLFSFHRGKPFTWFYPSHLSCLALGTLVGLTTESLLDRSKENITRKHGFF